VPSSCSVCTVDIYDLSKLWIWYGPSGAPSDLDISWLSDSSGLVSYQGKNLALVTSHSHVTGLYRIPRTLPGRWATQMNARMAGAEIELSNPVSGRTFVAHRTRGA
jgi:hypothetical protein